MKKLTWLTVSNLILFGLVGCASNKQAATIDIVKGSFPQAEAEVRTQIAKILEDVRISNFRALKDHHLDSPKFSKFGPRVNERQDVAATNRSELAAFAAISDLKVEFQDLKVDVFGDVAIATGFLRFTFTRDGEQGERVSRQTLVYVKTDQGWRIAHEHSSLSTQDRPET